MTRAAMKNNMKAISSKKVFCKSTIKRGINKGFYCAKLDCKKQNHLNIAQHLGLPKFMVDVVENNKTEFNHKKLISFFDFCSSNVLSEDKICVDHIKYILMLAYDKKQVVKYIYIIYLYKLFDTPIMHNFVNKYSEFINTSRNKLLEFQNTKPNKNNINFVVYLNETFVHDQKFFSRKKNVIDKFTNA